MKVAHAGRVTQEGRSRRARSRSMDSGLQRTRLPRFFRNRSQKVANRFDFRASNASAYRYGTVPYL